MELHFLGRGSAFNPLDKNTSAWFEVCGNLYVIDCGETVFETLLSQVELKRYQEIYVLITHLHSDHVGSLGSLLSYTYCMLQKKQVTVIYPDRKIIELLDIMGISRDFYRFEEKHESQSVAFTAIPVEHVKDMKCFGYLIQSNQEKIYYSGDASTIPAEVTAGFFHGSIQTIYQDTSTKEQSVHCHYRVLEELIPRAMRKRVFCMHLDSGSERLLEEKGFSVIKS